MSSPATSGTSSSASSAGSPAITPSPARPVSSALPAASSDTRRVAGDRVRRRSLSTTSATARDDVVVADVHHAHALGVAARSG